MRNAPEPAEVFGPTQVNAHGVERNPSLRAKEERNAAAKAENQVLGPGGKPSRLCRAEPIRSCGTEPAPSGAGEGKHMRGTERTPSGRRKGKRAAAEEGQVLGHGRRPKRPVLERACAPERNEIRAFGRGTKS